MPTISENTDIVQDRLRAGAAAVDQDLVCPGCIAAYLANALNSLIDHQSQQLALDNETTFRAFLKTKHVDYTVFSRLYVVRIPTPDEPQFEDRPLLEQ